MTVTREQLVEAGFVEKRYEGHEGVFPTKTLQAKDVPYVRDRLVGHGDVLPDSLVVVEVTPDRLVKMDISDADYLLGPFPLESDEALALLEDAGLTV